MSHEIGTIEFRAALDAATVGALVGRAAAVLGVTADEQRSLATTASAIARYAFQHTGGGRATLVLEQRDESRLLVQFSDEGRTPSRLHELVEELGDIRNLSDRLRLLEEPGRAPILEVAQRVPEILGNDLAERISRAKQAFGVLSPDPEGVPSEVQDLREALVGALGELRMRQQEIQRLNKELDDTNRGVLALYAELDDRAVDLARASEMKSRFLSSVSHELRTPLTSLVNLSQLLLARTDGELTPEQEYQVTLMRRSALGLMEMVNDLLDLARIEAGKSTLRVAEVAAHEVLAGVRGMFRPAMAPDGPALVIEEPDPGLVLATDEGKLSQVLRNFVSNAIKFTEHGEIRVSARLGSEESVTFSVSDTGVGIAPADHAVIFEEFAQVDGPHQRRVRGIGLGLSVSKRIANLLGGRITLESAVGVGSTFALVIPRVHPVARSEVDEYEGAPVERIRPPGEPSRG